MTYSRLLGTVSVEADDPAPYIKVPLLHLSVDDVDPTSASETGDEWADETNALSSDDSDAVYNDTSQAQLILSGFDLSSLPAGARVIGVEVAVEGAGGSATAGERDIDVALYSGGAVVGEATTIRLDQTTDAVITAGGAFDTWGVSGVFKASVLKASTFQVRISKTTATAAAINIDHVAITVHYTTNERCLDGGNTKVRYSLFTVDATATSLTAVGATTASADVAAQDVRVPAEDDYLWPAEPKGVFAGSTSTATVTCKEVVPG